MYIGIDIGGTNLVAAVTEKNGQIISKSNRAVDHAWSAEELCTQIAHLAKQAAEFGGIALDKVEAVGVGLPGLVDNEKGIVIQTPNMPFRNTPFRELFQKEWNIPVYLGNDANCAAIGEYWAGAAKGCTCPPSFPVCVCGKKPLVHVITRKPITSTPEELERNPRARSAKLRVCEKA